MLRHDQVHLEVTIGTKMLLEASIDFIQIKVRRTKIYLANRTTIINNPLGHLPYARTVTLKPFHA